MKSWIGSFAQFSSPSKFVIFLVFSFCINVFSLYIFKSDQPLESLDADESEYYHLAADMLNGVLNPSQHQRVLGHVGILSLILWLSGSNLWIARIMIAAIFSCCTPLVYLLVYRIIGNHRAACFSALLTALWPPFIFFSTTLYSETTALPFFLLFLLLLPRDFSEKRSDCPRGMYFRWFLAGGILGLCMHIRPMYLLYIPFALLVVYLEGRYFIKSFKYSVVLLLGCSLVVLPWSIFVSLQEKSFILLSTNGGETLAGGLNPNLLKEGYKDYPTASGRKTWEGPGKWTQDTGYLTKEESNLSEAQKNDILRQRALAWIQQNPGAALYLEGMKLFYMWGVYPFWNGFVQTFFGNIPTIILLLLGALSMLKFKGRLRGLVRFWSLPIFVSAVAMISWGSWRFRQPGDVGLIVMASLLVESFWPWGMGSGSKIQTKTQSHVGWNTRTLWNAHSTQRHRGTETQREELNIELKKNKLLF
jgi:Dolichyl-phosphate-mannose-protein mannosyltransferase